MGAPRVPTFKHACARARSRLLAPRDSTNEASTEAASNTRTLPTAPFFRRGGRGRARRAAVNRKRCLKQKDNDGRRAPGLKGGLGEAVADGGHCVRSLRRGYMWESGVRPGVMLALQRARLRRLGPPLAIGTAFVQPCGAPLRLHRGLHTRPLQLPLLRAGALGLTRWKASGALPAAARHAAASGAFSPSLFLCHFSSYSLVNFAQLCPLVFGALQAVFTLSLLAGTPLE